MMTLNEKNYESVKIYTKQLSKCLKTYRWITDAYVSDFFQKDHWGELPTTWQSFLPDLTTQELSFLLDKSLEPLRRVAPLSLLCFKTCCDVYSLDRTCVENVDSVLAQHFSSQKDKIQERNEGDGTAHRLLPDDSDGQLHAFFRKHVKPKKQHEIKRLAQVIKHLGEQIDCHNVVDVGSGLGHLARLLAFGYGLNVTSVEAADTHAPKATKYDREIDREIKKKIEALESKEAFGHISMPHHVTSMIYPNMSTRDFLATIQVPDAATHHAVLDNTADMDTTYDQLISVSKAETFCSAHSVDHNVRRCCTSQSGHFSGTKCLKLDTEVQARDAPESTYVSVTEKTNEPIFVPNSAYSEQNQNEDDISLSNSNRYIQTFSDNILTDNQNSISDISQTCKSEKYCMTNLPRDIFSQNQTFNFESKYDNTLGKTNHELAETVKNNLKNLCKETTKLNNCQTSAKGTVGQHQSSISDNSGKNDSLESAVTEYSSDKDQSHKMFAKRLALTQNQQTGYSNQRSSTSHFILTGLHACGDLTPTFLRFFVNCEAAVGLASVGCCYMKISDESIGSDTIGYPMSRFVTGLPDHQLSYATRELACHFADTYSQRLKECPVHLKIHSYRAALEWLANQLVPDFQRTAVQIPAKKTNTMDFKSYARLGLEKLGISTSNLTDDLLTQAERLTQQWKDVVVFYTIRLSLAPVVETLILLDRMFFLYENGYTSALCPVFDPAISPRNFVLLSWKQDQHH